VFVSEAFAEDLANAKQIAVSEQDEPTANELLWLELALATITSQLRMCIALKEDAAEAAWDHLVDAQAACSSAIRLQNQIGGPAPIDHLENHHSWLLEIETVIFPPQSFMSIGGTVSQRECSICGRSYAACDHVRGRAYMGRLCHTIISMMEVVEVSLVTSPANKRARVTHFSEGSMRRNKMTWRLEDTPDPPAI